MITQRIEGVCYILSLLYARTLLVAYPRGKHFGEVVFKHFHLAFFGEFGNYGGFCCHTCASYILPLLRRFITLSLLIGAVMINSNISSICMAVK